MATNYWTEEELAALHDNPKLLIDRAHMLRSKMICALLLRLKHWMVSLIK